jgi:L-ascorbate metabolism protein UlaG (beta-lactamase superfamily)
MGTETVQITYIGHSAFALNDGEHSVLIDPFITGNPAATLSADDFSPETVLLSHAHNDHVGDTVAIAKRTGAKVIATFELAEWLATQGLDDVEGGNHGGTLAFNGGTAKFTPAWHTSSYETADGTVAAGVAAGLIVRFGEKTMYFAGDTSLFGDMQMIGEEELDLAVVPIGGHFTMDPDDALKAVRMLSPIAVIPCHYNTFDAIRQDGAAFKQAVESETTARCLLLDPGETTEI